MTPDEIQLTIPRDRAYYSVAHLVLGGLGTRLNLTIENLEDLQLALDAVLERTRQAADVTIVLRLKDGEIEADIGPLHDEVRAELAATSGDEVGVRRILDTLVDRVDVAPGEGGDWVKLIKRVEGREE